MDEKIVFKKMCVYDREVYCDDGIINAKFIPSHDDIYKALFDRTELPDKGFDFAHLLDETDATFEVVVDFVPKDNGEYSITAKLLPMSFDVPEIDGFDYAIRLLPEEQQQLADIFERQFEKEGGLKGVLDNSDSASFFKQYNSFEGSERYNVPDGGYIIWSNIDDSLFKHNRDLDNDEKYLDVTKKLNVETEGKIVGQVLGGGYVDVGCNIRNIFYLMDNYSLTLYITAQGELYANLGKLDGDARLVVSTVHFRELKPELTAAQVANYKDMLLNNVTSEDFEAYTRELGARAANACSLIINTAEKDSIALPKAIKEAAPYDYGIGENGHLIYSDEEDYDPGTIESIMELIEDEYEIVTKDDVENRVADNSYFRLDDEKANLDIDTNTIYCFADSGFWDGRRTGYKEIGNNISDCLQRFVNSSYSNLTIYVDNEGELRSRENHHDGTNYYVFRALKDGLTDKQIEDFEDKLASFEFTNEDISKYTRRLGDDIGKVYGWEFPKETSKKNDLKQQDRD